MRTTTFSTLIVAASIAASAGAVAQQNVRISQDGRPERMFKPVSGLNSQDLQFVKTAWAANQFEILSSKIAQQKTQSGFISEFAKEMIQDHQGAQAELQQTVHNKSLALPAQLPTTLQAKLNQLRNLNGSAFTDAYRKAQLEGHKQAANAFKAEIQNGRDQDIKAYAVKTLPTVELHARMLLNKQTEMGDTKMSHGM